MPQITFDKDMCKLMNNSLYGKTLENKRNRIDIVLCTSAHKHVKAATNPRYRATRIFSEDLTAAVLTKCNVVLDCTHCHRGCSFRLVQAHYV